MRRYCMAVAVGCYALAVGSIPTVLAWEEEDFYRKPEVAYAVEEGDSVIGKLRGHRVQKGDTLFDIARQYSLGYNEIVDRNLGLDVWLPPPGALVLLPTAWVLPHGERRGVVINIPEMRLYYFHPSASDAGVTKVFTYAVGLGREEWKTPQGKFTVRSKTVDPTWVIPKSILEERIEEDGDDRTSIPGGAADNPLGKHRLALSLPSYAIHGTNIPWGVGMQVSHGCIRLYPEDVEGLFPLIPVGTPGEFVYQPVKVGLHHGEVYVEVTQDIYGLTPAIWKEARAMLERVGVADRVDHERLMAALQHPTGIPVKITGRPNGTAAAGAIHGVGVQHDARVSYTNER